jgi:hypothetical protein
MGKRITQLTKNAITTNCRYAQVTILRHRTEHNRLNQDMYHKFKIGETDLCTL